MEVPIGRTPRRDGAASSRSTSSSPKPGRMEQVIAEAAEVCEFVEANGAVNARLIQLTYAGPVSGMTAFTWEHESRAAHASMASAWFSAAGLALQAKMMTADPASVPVGSGALQRDPALGPSG